MPKFGKVACTRIKKPKFADTISEVISCPLDDY